MHSSASGYFAQLLILLACVSMTFGVILLSAMPSHGEKAIWLPNCLSSSV